MTSVNLRPISKANYKECLNLKVKSDQGHMVTNIYKSLADAYVDPNLHPFCVYDGSQRGWAPPKQPMIGFAMYQIEIGLGFILSLYIDHRFQRKGYGEATALELIRRLRLHPEVETIATSHHEKNTAVKKLFEKLGFVPWDIEWAKNVKDVEYLHLK